MNSKRYTRNLRKTGIVLFFTYGFFIAVSVFIATTRITVENSFNNIFFISIIISALFTLLHFLFSALYSYRISKKEDQILFQILEKDKELSSKNLQLNALLTNLPIMLFSTDIYGYISFSGGNASVFFGIIEDKIKGLTVKECFEFFPEVMNAVFNAIAGEVTVSTLKLNFLEFEFICLPLFNEKRKITGSISLFYDITKIKTVEKMIQKEKKNVEDLLEYIQRDLSTAKKIQLSILPKSSELPEQLNIYARYVPMDELGGDFYDVEEIRPNYFRFFVADATGHGVQAALITMIVKAEYESLKRQEDSVSILLEKINYRFCERHSNLNTLFTCAICDIDLNSNMLSFASAGHVEQIFISDGVSEKLHRTGKLIGYVNDAKYNLVEKKIKKSDRLFLFTDGVFEEFNSRGEIYGEERMFEILISKTRKGFDIEETSESLLKNLDLFLQGYGKQDDYVFLGIEIKYQMNELPLPESHRS